MESVLENLRDHAAEVASLLGLDPPLLVEEGTTEAVSERDWYLIGLIGGKEVGKSALVNALVGHPITETSSCGPGTEKVVAYAHSDLESSLRDYLDREVPGKFEIVTHHVTDLSKQVLLDLPDIDSHFSSHIEVTRRMVRGMLFPIWIQSVEKYADKAPAELLRKVAEGNSPENFVFCLNKIDQLESAGGPEAVAEIRDDWSERIASRLGLEHPPQVMMVSATNPEKGDLPVLRERLGRQKSAQDLASSKRLAAEQHGLSLLKWIDRQDLPGHIESANRIGKEMESEIVARVGVPLLERIVPRIEADPSQRIELGYEIQKKRAERWPMVNLVHGMLSAISRLIRLRLRLGSEFGGEDAEALVDRYLPAEDPSTVGSIESAFAYLQASQPKTIELYADRKYWERETAERALADLRRRLADTLEDQAAVVRQRLSPHGGLGGVLVRWILTYGAVLWFPFGQPLLQEYFTSGGWDNLAALVVKLFGVSYLLSSGLFLFLYFIFLWAILKWRSQRQVDRLFAKWSQERNVDSSLSLREQVSEWLRALLAPVLDYTDRLEALHSRTEDLRRRL